METRRFKLRSFSRTSFGNKWRRGRRSKRDKGDSRSLAYMEIDMGVLKNRVASRVNRSGRSECRKAAWKEKKREIVGSEKIQRSRS